MNFADTEQRDRANVGSSFFHTVDLKSCTLKIRKDFVWKTYKFIAKKVTPNLELGNVGVGVAGPASFVRFPTASGPDWSRGQ